MLLISSAGAAEPGSDLPIPVSKTAHRGTACSSPACRASLDPSPLDQELRSMAWLNFRLCCPGPAQRYHHWAKTSCNHITVTAIAFKRACAELLYFCSLHIHKNHTEYSGVRKKCHEFSSYWYFWPNLRRDMSLVMGSNKYPLPGSHCRGWERKQQPKGCHILETWPGKKDPQLTRWVRESRLSLKKKKKQPMWQTVLKHPRYYWWIFCWWEEFKGVLLAFCTEREQIYSMALNKYIAAVNFFSTLQFTSDLCWPSFFLLIKPLACKWAISYIKLVDGKGGNSTRDL